MTEEEIARVETIVNEKIAAGISLDERRNVPIAQAKDLGAMALFGEKYGDNVRVIIFDPCISLASCPVYGLLHHEPIGWRTKINFEPGFPPPRDYYAAQGNATRLFFRNQFPDWHRDWRVSHAEAMAAFSYLFSGGFSKPAMYPAFAYPLLKGVDKLLSVAPRLFAARCLVTMEVAPTSV